MRGELPNLKPRASKRSGIPSAFQFSFQVTAVPSDRPLQGGIVPASRDPLSGRCPTQGYPKPFLPHHSLWHEIYPNWSYLTVRWFVLPSQVHEYCIPAPFPPAVSVSALSPCSQFLCVGNLLGSPPACISYFHPTALPISLTCCFLGCSL